MIFVVLFGEYLVALLLGDICCAFFVNIWWNFFWVIFVVIFGKYSVTFFLVIFVVIFGKYLVNFFW